MLFAGAAACSLDSPHNLNTDLAQRASHILDEGAGEPYNFPLLKDEFEQWKAAYRTPDAAVASKHASSIAAEITRLTKERTDRPNADIAAYDAAIAYHTKRKAIADKRVYIEEQLTILSGSKKPHFPSLFKTLDSVNNLFWTAHAEYTMRCKQAQEDAEVAQREWEASGRHQALVTTFPHKISTAPAGVIYELHKNFNGEILAILNATGGLPADAKRLDLLHATLGHHPFLQLAKRLDTLFAMSSKKLQTK